MKLKITTNELVKKSPTKKRVLNNQKVESVQIQKKKVTQIVFV